MRVVIEVPGLEAVCFYAPVVETYRATGLRRRHPGSALLGPDLCDPDARRRRVRGADAPVLRRDHDGGRAPARPAGRGRRGQRLQERGAVGLRRPPVHPGGRARSRSTRSRLLDDGLGFPAGQPRPAHPHHPARQCRGGGGLRALRQALLPLWHADRGSPGMASSPGSPTGARTANASRHPGCRRGRRPTPRRRSTSTPRGSVADRSPSTTPATSAAPSTPKP